MNPASGTGGEELQTDNHGRGTSSSQKSDGLCVAVDPEPRSRSGNVDWTTRTTPAHEEQSEGQLEREGDGNSSPLFLSPPHSPVLPFVSLLLGPSTLTSFQVPRSRGEVKGQGSRLQGFGSHNRENRHCRPSMRIPGSYNKSGRAVCPSGGDDPDTRDPLSVGSVI
ncbi:hypothetical protein DPEC_G00379640 [Dallia pectoralis]|nr:hypothetical protein DPEC_G00379640 [Dallia pectoralis]